LHVDLGPGGEVLFGGTTDGAPWAYSTGGLAAVAGELDASGATSWIHQFGGESTYLPLAVRITADGTRVTAGTTPEGLFMRTVDHLGASLTFESFGNEALGESVSAMSVARDRSIVVAGQTETGLGDLDPGPGPSGWRNPYVIRFTQLGDLDWVARLIADSEMLDSAESVEVDGSGRIHLIGSRYRGQTYVAQLQGNGAQAWLDPLYFEFESWYRFGFDVAASSAGRTLAVGRWEPPNPYSPPRGFLAAYPASGAPATVTIVGPAEFTTATAVAAAPDDFTVVAGVTHGLFGEVLGSATQAAAFLAKYAPDGTLVWVRSVAPGRDTEISDVAVGHDGSTTLVGTVDGQVLVARYGP
jgi:hypothetical protein